MTHDPTAATAFWVDAAYDRDYASDGQSRFGSYLRDRAHRFHDEDTGAPLPDPVVFAVRAFVIASSPIMSPGYVHHHPRVQHVVACVDDQRRSGFEVRVAAPLPAPVDRAIGGRGWAGWQRDRSVAGEGAWWAPDDLDRPAAYTVVAVRVPVTPELLPAPAYRDGLPVVPVAQTAVGAVCALLNQHLGGILAAPDATGP